MEIRNSWSIGLIGILLAGCVGATVTGWYYAKEDAEHRANERFRFRANLVKTAIVERMKAYEQVLRGGVALFHVDDDVTRADWHSYVANLKIDNNYPGIQGIGHSKRIAPAELAAHIQEIRAEGFPDYVLKPPGERAEYTAIIYLEPFDQRNRRAFGFDMFSEPTRRAAMELARDSGETAVSGRVTLVQEAKTDVQAGFLMYLPLYRHGMPLGDVEQRRAALLGYVYSPFRMNDLMRGILGDQEDEVSLTVYDGRSVRAESLMYDSTSRQNRHTPQFFLSEPLNINNHAWLMQVHSKPAFEATVDRQKPLFILVFGSSISGLVAMLAWAWISTRSRAEGIAHDMTQAMREREERLRSIVDTAVDGIIVINERGIVESFNTSAERIFGYTAGEVIGCNINMLMPEPYHSAHDGYLQHYVQTNKARIIGIGREVVGLRKDGSTFPLDLAVGEMKIQDGVRLFTGIVRDVTERKKVDRLKNEFVSTVSHELRTPLTSIRGSLGLILGGVAGELAPQAKNLVDIAYKNSERLVRLINDILDIEKIESGKMEFDLKPQELMPLVQHAIDANQAYGEQYGVRFELIASLPQAKVIVDNDRLMQVMSNLLSNAAKFSPQGGRVEIAVTHEPGFIRVAVSDHGSGIPEEFRDKIFQKFSQADSSDTRQKGGTGLGLSITKAIVEKMGGETGFDTQSGAGTTFYFRLPEYAENGVCQTGQIPAKATRPAVLVCEDDADVARLIGMMLEQGGFDAETAASVQEARQKLGERGYAAMTLGLGLPDGDGIDLIRELRGQEATRHLPVVVVSGHSGESQQARLDGSFAVVDWLGKPIDNDALVQAVQRAVHSFGGYRPRILHIEDDADIRQVVGSMISNIADIDYASNVQEAAAMLGLERYHLVILDIGLPDGSGWELLPQIKHINPPPQVVVFSAHNVAQDMARQVAAALVKSQTSDRELLETISMLVRKKPA